MSSYFATAGNREVGGRCCYELIGSVQIGEKMHDINSCRCSKGSSSSALDPTSKVVRVHTTRLDPCDIYDIADWPTMAIAVINSELLRNVLMLRL